jgi:hypothetical protein
MRIMLFIANSDMKDLVTVTILMILSYDLVVYLIERVVQAQDLY